MANKGGPEKAKYDKQYESTPEQKKKRAERNAARREYEAKNGPLPANTDIDHKKMLKDGGTNAEGNLRAVSETKNRGWRKGKKGYS